MNEEIVIFADWEAIERKICEDLIKTIPAEMNLSAEILDKQNLRNDPFADAIRHLKLGNKHWR